MQLPLAGVSRQGQAELSAEPHAELHLRRTEMFEADQPKERANFRCRRIGPRLQDANHQAADAI